MATHELLISIKDDQSSPDEQWECRVPLETDRLEIAKAIETLYPTAFFYSIEIVEIPQG